MSLTNQILEVATLATPAKLTGTLKDASLLGVRPDQTLRGAIYGDTRGCFNDGEYVITSFVVEVLPDNVYRTRNSTYKVEFAK
jgi:hypothetical protein